MGVASNAHGKEQKFMQNFDRINTKGGHHLGGMCVDRRILLKCILKK